MVCACNIFSFSDWRSDVVTALLLGAAFHVRMEGSDFCHWLHLLHQSGTSLPCLGSFGPRQILPASSGLPPAWMPALTLFDAPIKSLFCLPCCEGCLSVIQVNSLHILKGVFCSYFRCKQSSFFYFKDGITSPLTSFKGFAVLLVKLPALLIVWNLCARACTGPNGAQTDLRTAFLCSVQTK